jgi:hypothetical protein
MNINFKRFGFASIVAAGSLIGILSPSPASADLCVSTTSCVLALTQGNAGSGFGTGNFGTVDLERSGTTVTITVSLASGFKIIDTGFPGSFGFGDNLGGGLTIGGFSAPGYSGGISSATNNQHFDGFGFTNDVGATTGPSAGDSNAVGTVSFTVSGAGLTDVEDLVNLFNPAGGDGPAVFVVDAFNSNTSGPGAGKTGLISATTVNTPVPEPGSLAMFGTTLLLLGGIGYIMRRRREDEV